MGHRSSEGSGISAFSSLLQAAEPVWYELRNAMSSAGNLGPYDIVQIHQAFHQEEQGNQSFPTGAFV